MEQSVQEVKKKRAEWQIKIDKFLDSFPVVGFMSAITVYTLFFDDIRTLIVTVHQDAYFYGLTCAFLVFFTVEIVLASISKEEYFNSFFFWLDAVSTASLLPDIGWVWAAWTGSGGSNSGGNAA